MDEQPAPISIYILAILTNPAYPYEVTDKHELDLELSAVKPPPGSCVFGSPNAPVPVFTITPNPGVINGQVCFNASGSTDNGVITGFGWDFGDGSTGAGPFTCHTYDSAGVFPVSLLVQDQDHNCSETSQIVTIGPGEPASCSIVVSPTPVVTGQNTTFTAVVTDPDGRVRRFSWSFGDGASTSTSRNSVTHRYNTPGSYAVLLTITDDQGNVSTCQTSVSVADADPSGGAPTCSFTVSPTNIIVGNAVTVNATSSTDDGQIVLYNVDFGDGTTATYDCDIQDCSGQILISKPGPYVAEGTYTITLLVTDDDGERSSCTQQVTVCPVGGCGATTQCSDGSDNDSDGFIDLADPQCTGPADDNETT
jgi:PKD repeat protein